LWLCCPQAHPNPHPVLQRTPEPHPFPAPLPPTPGVHGHPAGHDGGERDAPRDRGRHRLQRRRRQRVVPGAPPQAGDWTPDGFVRKGPGGTSPFGSSSSPSSRPSGSRPFPAPSLFVGAHRGPQSLCRNDRTNTTACSSASDPYCTLQLYSVLCAFYSSPLRPLFSPPTWRPPHRGDGGGGCPGRGTCT